MTNRCITSAVKNTPTVPAMGAITSPPTNARNPWSPLAPNSQVTPPGGAQEGEQPDEDDGDLDADQGEHQWAQEASLPREPREEGRRLEDHAPYDVYETVERIGEVVVPSGGGCCGSHLSRSFAVDVSGALLSTTLLASASRRNEGTAVPALLTQSRRAGL